MAVLVASMVSLAVNAGQPKLVVGIVIDGLQQEYLDLLKDRFSQDGFNRLLREGVVLENVDYGTSLDATAATAVIMTGAAPSINGIAGALHYDPEARRHVSSVHDPEAVGNFTNETYSAKNLRVTTLSDESRIAGGGVSHAYSIAPDPAQAIIMAGHAANSAVWINDKTANWSSTTYYGDIPSPAMLVNRTSPIALRLDSMEWVPSASLKNLPFLPDHLTRYPFRYTYPNGHNDRIASYKASPLANAEIAGLAADYIRNISLGGHEATDMLNVAFTLQPYDFSRTPENRYELADSYVKLDRDLAYLFGTIDRQVGRENALIYVAATPPASTRRREDEKWNIPSGEFSTRKAASLLNLYLIALHGNGEWVKAFSDDSFYLNKQLIKDLNQDEQKIRREAADFLKRMSGIDRAVTIDDILDADTGMDNPEAMRRNTVVELAGDVKLFLAPGWELVDDYNRPGFKSNKVKVNTLTTAPAFILAPGIAHEVIRGKVDARAIAPTIAGQMHIRSPNGATVAPLRFDSSKN